MTVPRHRTPELMDDPALPAREHRLALAGLARINAMSRSWAVLWREIERLSSELGPGQSRPLRVLDVATGSADVPIAIARCAAARGLNLELFACDSSATALGVAGERARVAGVKLSTFTVDVLASDEAWHSVLASHAPPGTFDVVTCSLFLHHMDPPQVVTVLGRMAGASRQLVLAHDLDRTRAGLVLASVVPRLLTRSRVVHVDAVRSVRGAFTASELRAMAEQAGLSGALVARTFPQRLLLRFRQPGMRREGHPA